MRYKTTLAEIGEGKHYQLFHGNSIVPTGLENRSVRYFSTSIPLACAVEITEYKRVLCIYRPQNRNCTDLKPKGNVYKTPHLPLTVHGKCPVKRACLKWNQTSSYQLLLLLYGVIVELNRISG